MPSALMSRLTIRPRALLSHNFLLRQQSLFCGSVFSYCADVTDASDGHQVNAEGSMPGTATLEQKQKQKYARAAWMLAKQGIKGTDLYSARVCP